MKNQLNPAYERVDGTVRRTGLPRSTVYEKLKDGTFLAKKDGRRTLVNVTSVDKWLASLEDYRAPGVLHPRTRAAGKQP